MELSANSRVIIHDFPLIFDKRLQAEIDEYRIQEWRHTEWCSSYDDENDHDHCLLCQHHLCMKCGPEHRYGYRLVNIPPDKQWMAEEGWLCEECYHRFIAADTVTLEDGNVVELPLRDAVE